MRILLLIGLAFASVAHAETVRYTNAKLFGSNASELIVRGNHFVESASKVDRVVDLKGAFVVPHLVDAHAHLLGLGRALVVVDLLGTTSFEEVVARVKKHAPKDGWILGRGWDQNDWSVKEFPEHSLLTRAFPKRPVMLTRVDGHALIANSEAMRLSGVSGKTPTPKGGRIIRNLKGQLTGVFIDNAMALVRKAQPELTVKQREQLLKRAFARSLAVGLTGVHDMGLDQPTVRAFKSLDKRGELPIRVYGYLNGIVAGQAPFKGKMFSVIGVKLFSDGALGSRGAALLEPYTDEPKWRGLLQHSPDKLTKLASLAVQSGFQVAIHAIGDRGVRTALDTLKKSGRTRLPNRVEHAQVIALSDIPRFSAEGVVASMQPTHCTSDMPWAEQRVGPKRIRGAYAWQTLLRSGAQLVFGSDFPVESPEPLKGIYAAVTRRDANGKPNQGWYPKQRLNISEALTAFTQSALKVVGGDARNADFVVFDRDLRSISVEEITQVTVLRVIVDGVEVYKSQH